MVLRCAARFRDVAYDIVTAAQWASYLEDAYQDVVAASPYWPFLESRATVNVTTTGTVALPSDSWKVTAVYNDTDKYPLAPIDGRVEYRHMFPDPAAAVGPPRYYRLRGANIDVFPTPLVTTALILDTRLPPAALTASTEPIFPEQYHRALVSGALAYAYEDDGNPAQAGIHRGTFDKLLYAMIQDLLDTRTEHYPTILDTWDS